MEEKRDGRSCLKIFRCVGDLPENDDSGSVQDGGSSRRKCKWRFGKRSERRRVLNNNALLTEPTSESVTVVVGEKEKKKVEEDTSEILPPPPAKISVVKFAEHTSIIPPQPTTDDDDCQIEDSIVILIQTSIRRFLAQKEMAKLQSIVKLQASVRGHLVRRQAIGTLRCVQAIVKLQALVRSRQHRSAENTVSEDGVIQSTGSQAKGSEKDIIFDTKQTKQNIMHSSTEKLLANGFARQLLELPGGREKVIHISFDPSRSDSAWKWLERWMTVTSSDVVSPHQEVGMGSTEVQITTVSVSCHSDEKQEATECKDDENSVILVEDQIALDDESDVPSKFPIVEFHDPPMPPISKQICGITRMDESTIEEDSDESKRFGIMLRKSCNPVVTAVQSIFEEPSAVSKSDMRLSGDDTKSETDHFISNPNLADEPPPPQFDVDVFKKLEMNLITETVASRCGTEISVSSTLDSPDNLTEAEVIVEAEDGEMLFEIGALNASNDHNHENADSETTPQEQKIEEIDIIHPGNRILTYSDHTVPTDEEPKHEQETDQEGNRLHLSPESSNSMLGTTPERRTYHSNIEQGKKTNARLSAKKSRFQLSGSISPANPNTEATPDNLPKTGKRKNLTGTRKLDDSGDFEPTRMSSSSSSNSLPSYMQATESARAKVHASNSPKPASPDMHQQQNKESYTTKKRHSLPFIDGKHASSPRMQQQSSKGTNTTSPQNPAAKRKWRR